MMNIGDICSREVVTADRSSNLRQAAVLMRQHHEAVAAMKQRGVRRLLVSGEDGHLFGIVALDDLLDALAMEMSEVAQAVRSGIARETAERPPLPAPEAQSVRVQPFSIGY